MNLPEFTVVLNAASAARFKEGEGVEFTLSPHPSDESSSSVPVIVRTKWMDEGYESFVPRGLWIEVRLRAASPLAAAELAAGPAWFLSTLAAFCANVPSGEPELHLAYESEPRDGGRDFIQVILPAEHGLPSAGRVIDRDEYVDLFSAISNSQSIARISRVLRQYALALDHWHVGGEWLALAHLYMAVEALTGAVINHECKQLGLTKEELARDKGIDVDKDNWSHKLEVAIRRDSIFSGDEDAYRSARYASDGIEHGFLAHGEVVANATAAVSQTFKYVRTALLRIVGLPISSPLAERLPLDVKTYKTVINGRLIGEASDPASPGRRYPEVHVGSEVKAFRKNGDSFSVEAEYEFRVIVAQDVSVNLGISEIRSRMHEHGIESNFREGSGSTEGRSAANPTEDPR